MAACGRGRVIAQTVSGSPCSPGLSSDVRELKLISSIPPHRPRQASRRVRPPRPARRSIRYTEFEIVPLTKHRIVCYEFHNNGIIREPEFWPPRPSTFG
jgi:hypothetical protein